MLIEFYIEVQSKFSVDEQRHYNFTPRNLTQIIMGLMNYDYSSGDSKELLYEALQNEIQRSFRDKLVNFES